MFCRKQALVAKAEADKEGIVVPLTLEDYCIKPKEKPSNQDPPVSVFIIAIIDVLWVGTSRSPLTEPLLS